MKPRGREYYSSLQANPSLGLRLRGKPSTLAQSALRKALAYYLIHAKAAEADEEIRSVAEAHWHPEITERWDHYFGKILDELLERAREAEN